VEGPLVETKLHVPTVRRGLVTRPRLSEPLGRGAASKLTLLSAPAGFGKTTLLSAWLANAGGRKRSVAWLSLDESDRPPAVFWTYVVSALQRVVPDAGAILVLQALAHQAGGDGAAARAPLERALTLAEPERYVRVFVDAGFPMGRQGVKPKLVDPLSERELDVLRLLATDLDGPDIARRLHVSLNTLRTHTKNIYAKLGVNSRRAAVRRAGELHLL
jgi:ATP/maltotriose-dependent transcriptional regulator MalT